MAGEYDINLSNGNRLATLYPLEVNGPDNRSTPRQIQDTLPEFIIVQVSGGNVFKVAGNQVGYFPVGLQFSVVNSTGSPSNDGTFTVDGVGSPIGSPPDVPVFYDGGQDETNIRVTTNIPNPAASGEIVINAFVPYFASRRPRRAIVCFICIEIYNIVKAHPRPSIERFIQSQ